MRVFGVYGPGQTEMLIPGIISRIQRGEEVQLAQDEGLFLTLLYIDDCVEIIHRLLAQPAAPALTVVNLAGNDSLSLAEMTRVIGERLRLEPNKRITSAAPLYLQGDNTRMRKLVGYEPRISFAQGVNAIVASLNN
jgi:nucleoside-diphosphate-sugar epimerase